MTAKVTACGVGLAANGVVAPELWTQVMVIVSVLDAKGLTTSRTIRVVDTGVRSAATAAPAVGCTEVQSTAPSVSKMLALASIVIVSALAYAMLGVHTNVAVVGTRFATNWSTVAVKAVASASALPAKLIITKRRWSPFTATRAARESEQPTPGGGERGTGN